MADERPPVSFSKHERGEKRSSVPSSDNSTSFAVFDVLPALYFDSEREAYKTCE